MREKFDHLLHELSEIEGGVVQLHPAGLDPGEIEDVVDDLEKRLPGATDDFHGPALFARQVPLEEEVRHSKDPIHGGSDLVAHFRKELGLRDACGFRGIPCENEFLPAPRQFPVPGLDEGKHLVESLDQFPDLVSADAFAAQTEILLDRYGLHRACQLHDRTRNLRGEAQGEEVRAKESAEQDQAGKDEVPLHAVPQFPERGSQDHRAGGLSLEHDGRYRIDGMEIPGAGLLAERFQRPGAHIPMAGSNRHPGGEILRGGLVGNIGGQDLVVPREQVGGEDRVVLFKPHQRLRRHFPVSEHDRGNAVVADNVRGRFEVLLRIRTEGHRLVDHEHDRGPGQDDSAGQKNDRHQFLP